METAKKCYSGEAEVLDIKRLLCNPGAVPAPSGILIAPGHVMPIGLSFHRLHRGRLSALAFGAAPALGVVAIAMTLSGCGGTARLPLDAGVGPRPAIPPPEKSLLPTLNIAPAKGWPPGGTPIP